MTTPVTRRTVLAGTGAAALLSATGVSLADQHDGDDENGPEENGPEENGPEFAAINAVHASPDAPNVDVYVNGVRVLDDVAFRDISDYLVLLEGEYRVQIVPLADAGEDDDTDESDADDAADESADNDDVDLETDAVIDEEVSVPAGVATAAVVGEVRDDAEQELELLLLEVDLDDLADDESRVRAVHASPDAPAVDIAADGDVVVEDLAFGEDATVDVPEGEYELEVRPAGEDDAVAEFDIELDAGVVYSAYAVGYLDPEEVESDEEFDLLVHVDALTPVADVVEDEPTDDDPTDTEPDDEDADDDPDDDTDDDTETASDDY